MLKYSYNDSWRDFHLTALAYLDNPDPDQTRNIINYYTNRFKNKVACGTCRLHYIKLIRQKPILADSKTQLFNWTVDIHNEINRKLKKPIISYHTALQYWTDIRNNLISQKQVK